MNEMIKKLVYKNRKPTKSVPDLIQINVEKDGKPFGQLWTWKDTEDTFHPWHAKPLHGSHMTFDGSVNGLIAAKKYLESFVK